METELPIPPHFDLGKVGQLWKVPYEDRAAEALSWADRYGIRPSRKDLMRLGLLLVDVQNTFCLPGFELFVGGRSGTGAVDDNRRLCEFIYRNLSLITRIIPTMDTHYAMQIFHAIALVDDKGAHPSPFTLVSEEDIRAGKWRLNPELCDDPSYLHHYARKLKEGGKYDLTIWPYHALLGSIGHALVPAVEEAIFFHSVARRSRPDFQIKGDNPLTEHYSILGPEVREGVDGRPIAAKNLALIEEIFRYDAVVITGQAKSHCVAWTLAYLLEEIRGRDASFAKRVFLLEDCTSPVVIPGVIDYTDSANDAFRRFSEAGMNVVRSTDPIRAWAGMHELVGLKIEDRVSTRDRSFS
jgi:nicotinamidase-related amidase